MKRILAVLVAIAMLVSITGPAMALADPATSTSTDIEPLAQTTDADLNNTTANETPPGVMLAGSIAVHQEEIQGEIEHRSFGLQVAAAATNDSKAQVLNRTQEQLQERVTEMDREMIRLNESRANGTISESQYQVRMSGLLTGSSNLERMANSTNQTAAMLPQETLEANGVNVTALEQIRTHAHNMTGPETAEMARQIAGNSVGTPMGPPQDMMWGPMSGSSGSPAAGADNETGMGDGTTSGDRNGDGMMGQPTTTTTTETPTDAGQ